LKFLKNNSYNLVWKDPEKRRVQGRYKFSDMNV